MPNWHEILNEIQEHQNEHSAAAAQTIDRIRRRHLKSLAALTQRNVIAYYSAFLTKPNVEGIDISDDDINSLMACIHKMDRSKGLDLILHTPGGAIAATEAIAHYLRQMFGRDIRAIVPQIAMSAGTMLALSCNCIVLGKQSSLGPIDPQIGGIPADVVVTEFARAYAEIKEDANKAHVWAPILSRYMPSFLTQCEYAVEWSKKFVQEMLQTNMFADDDDAVEKAAGVVTALSSAELNKAHNKHIHADKLQSLKVNVERLENSPELQDAVLTVHHCFVHTLASTTTIKIVENDEGRAAVRHMAHQTPGQSISIGFGSPS